MNAAQQSALEGLLGKALSASDITTLDPYVAARNDVAIADYLSNGRVKVGKVEIADIQARLQSTGEWWVIKATAADSSSPQFQAANVVMDVATARYTNVDFTLPLVGQKFGELVAGGQMSQATLDSLNGLASSPDPIHYNQVSDALNVAEGRNTL